MKPTSVLFSLFAFAVVVSLFQSPAHAIGEFGNQWKDKFLEGDDVDPDFKKTAKKANCYICHVKGEKKEVRNEYGDAVNKFLHKEDFEKAYVKENPEEAKEKILAGFKQANELKSTDGKVFGEKIKASELPATNAGLDD